MPKYRLHYAGSTFELKDSETAHEVIALIEDIQGRDAGQRREVQLTGGGSVQVFVSRYTPIALSVEP